MLTDNQELFIIGIITALIMLYLGWKTLVLVMRVIIFNLSKDQRAPPPVRLRKRGPWDI